ncbi:MAG: hypothetical protein V8R82_00795 [Clostridia bacterium]
MQRIFSHMRKAIEEYKMIEEGDKIAICLSGGKDSSQCYMPLNTYRDSILKNLK